MSGDDRKRSWWHALVGVFIGSMMGLAFVGLAPVSPALAWTGFAVCVIGAGWAMYLGGERTFEFLLASLGGRKPPTGDR